MGPAFIFPQGPRRVRAPGFVNWSMVGDALIWAAVVVGGSAFWTAFVFAVAKLFAAGKGGACG